MHLTSIISKEYFESLKEYRKAFEQFASKVLLNTTLREKLGLSNVPDTERKEDDPLGQLPDFWLDIDVCLSLTSREINNNKDVETFALIVFSNEVVRSTPFESLDQLDLESDWSTWKEMINLYREEYDEDFGKDYSKISELALTLYKYDKDLAEEYLTYLYRFISLVIKADGKVTKMEEEILKSIIKFVESDSENKNGSIVKSLVINNGQSLQTALDELNSLIGLSAVKQEINTLTNFIRVQKQREQVGLKSSSVSYHIVFTGNAGTGKTTVARIVAEIYKHLGVLKKGHIVETDRSGLIAEYVGQTAIKVNNLVDSALDGVLFIDEAYAIAGEGQNDFGKEAIATLIKRMEDNRDRLVVIVAGYTKEMHQFISTNPGIKSRFNRYIEFSDYTPSELLAIYESHCRKLDYKLTEEAKVKLQGMFNEVYSKRDHAFGNGRFVRNIFEKCQERQANRLASVPVITNEMFALIEGEDIP